MPRYNPYFFWTRDELEKHLVIQCKWFKREDLTERIRNAVYDKRWNPLVDYNGCSVVQDRYHPYVPCFLHDYAWVVLKGGIEHDKEFEKNLRDFGMNKFNAKKWFLGVRMGWLFMKRKVRK